jgi:DNA-binding IclR family transcriptional regulator
MANFDLVQVARPLMQKLADDTGLTVAIGTLEKNRMVYMDACQGPALIALQLKVGSRLPLFSTAMGRAYLATISSEKRANFTDKYGLSN